VRFDRVVIADWSAGSTPSPLRPSADAIWIGLADDTGCTSQYHRTRASAEAALWGEVIRAQSDGARLLIGCDFPFGYPAGFAAALTGSARARAVWDYLAAQITDGADNSNNRFAVAGAMNAALAPQGGFGPFWGRPAGRDIAHLPARKLADYAAFPFEERREIDKRIPSAQPVWKLFTTGSVGSQSLMGLPMIARLAQKGGVTAWPFDEVLGTIVLAEVYPSLLARDVTAEMRQTRGAIKDDVQVRLLARALHRQSAQTWAQMLALPHALAREEGWILGAGFANDLAKS
jgi:hypothetical protein